MDTGDLGFLAEGELYLTGRAKDILLINGRNIAPEVLEQAMSGVEALRTGCVAAFSTTDPNSNTEVAMLLVEHRQKASAAEQTALAEACRAAALSGVGMKVQVEVLAPGTLPRTSSGKIRRGAARKQWKSGTLASPRNVGAFSMIAAMVDSSRHMPSRGG